MNIVKIVECIATASILLLPNFQPIPNVNAYDSYIEVKSNPSSSYASTITYSPQLERNDIKSEMPIKGYMKVRIRNTQKKMEWN